MKYRDNRRHRYGYVWMVPDFELGRMFLPGFPEPEYREDLQPSEYLVPKMLEDEVTDVLCRPVNYYGYMHSSGWRNFTQTGTEAR